MIINSKQSLSDAIIELKNDFEQHKWLQVKVSKGSRTLRMNAWWNKAYDMLGRQGDMTLVEYRRHCKYTFGLPILFADDQETADIWRTVFKSVDYEQRLIMMDKMDVTKLFNVDEGSKYIHEIINAFSHFELPEKVK